MNERETERFDGPGMHAANELHIENKQNTQRFFPKNDRQDFNYNCHHYIDLVAIHNQICVASVILLKSRKDD